MNENFVIESGEGPNPCGKGEKVSGARLFYEKL